MGPDPGPPSSSSSLRTLTTPTYLSDRCSSLSLSASLTFSLYCKASLGRGARRADGDGQNAGKRRKRGGH